ncbi:LapA family protein [Rhodococcus erythropolis]|uniref:LapA family protein n=1 Tax=Rhodococcus erythropolis TaxID=1833 RepID=UPI001E52ABE4|nr:MULTISPECIES: LapA family protein [Rhodococcus erythropolis group]MCD2105921.1 LapA family protein [Rhodococcus qingshengii]MCZ4524344.1 LapA family protein [Rhodococcus erythropolis]
MSSETRNTTARSVLTSRNTLALLLVVLAVIFILQNRAATTIQLFWVSVQSPLWLILVVILVLGWIAGLLTNRRAKTAT